MNSIDDNPSPNGEMSLQTIAMPKDTNASGDIFGGWLLSVRSLAAIPKWSMLVVVLFR